MIEAGCGYFVYREFGPLCWRLVLPVVRHATVESAVEAARAKAAEYKWNDEARFVVSTDRDGTVLFQVVGGGE